MKVIADWIELKVKQFDDGSFEAYETLTDGWCLGTWDEVRNWIEKRLLTKTEDEINKSKGDGE